MAVLPPLPGTFILNLPLAINLTGDDDFVIVQGGTTKRVLFRTITGQISPIGNVPVVITSGATVGSPFIVPTGVNEVLVNKTVGAATWIQFALASTYGATAILVKDIKGDAATNNITIQFTGGETVEGLTTIVLSTNYASIRLTPLPGGGGFFIT